MILSLRPVATECNLAAFGTIRTSDAEMPALRKATIASVPPNTLKYVDDQAIAAVAAVLRASEDFGQSRADFANWGVVAAPRFLGRASFAESLERFDRRGASSVSPLIIPYLSLHSVAGSLSLALGIHGPSLGAGGGPDSLAEGLLAAMTLHAQERLPGVWVVLTEYSPEPGMTGATPECHAVALALRPAKTAGARMRLTFAASDAKTMTVAELAERLGCESTAWSCALSGGLVLQAHGRPARRVAQAA